MSCISTTITITIITLGAIPLTTTSPLNATTPNTTTPNIATPNTTTPNTFQPTDKDRALARSCDCTVAAVITAINLAWGASYPPQHKRIQAAAILAAQ